MYVRVYDSKQNDILNYQVKNICTVRVVMNNVYIFDREYMNMYHVCDLANCSYVHVSSTILEDFIFGTNPAISDLLDLISKCRFVYFNAYMYGIEYFMLHKYPKCKDEKIHRFRISQWSKTCDIEIK